MDGGSNSSGPEGAMIIPFPERSCYSCEHCYIGVKGIWCEMWSDFILDADAAQDCEVYDPA